MRHNIFSGLGSMMLVLLMAIGLASCSSDDDYQAAPALAADNQQVHFSGDNEATVIIDPTDKSTYAISIKVARNTKKGKLSVPIVKNSSTTAGITVDDSVVFQDGDSIATFSVNIPDTAETAQAFKYSLTLNSDQVDPYSVLDGGYTLDATASIPATVKVKCWMDGQLTTPWEESALDLGGGVYRITNFMHSGYGLVLTIQDGKLSVSLPAGSPLYAEDDEGATYIYWYTDDYVHLYPYGKEGGVDINDFVIYNSATYNSWHAQNKYGLFMLQEFQTSEMTEPAYWVWFCFQLK